MSRASRPSPCCNRRSICIGLDIPAGRGVFRCAGCGRERVVLLDGNRPVLTLVVDNVAKRSEVTP